MKRLFVAAAVLVGLTSPALAKHCPKDAEIVGQAIGEAKGLSKTQLAEAQGLHAKGVAFHKNGKHAESIKAFHAATKLLGVEPYKPK